MNWLKIIISILTAAGSGYTAGGEEAAVAAVIGYFVGVIQTSPVQDGWIGFLKRLILALKR